MAISSNSCRLFFLVTLFSFTAHLLLQAVQELPGASAAQQWTNDISLGSNSYPGGKFRSILLRSNPATFGPSIALGFICNDPCDTYFFALFFVETNDDGSIKETAAPRLLWSVKDKPVEENAMVVFDGNLILRNGQGTMVWSTGTSGNVVVGINISDPGNLVLFDRENRTVWQSMDQPGNVLLVGQTLGKGQNLTQGDFYITVQDDGLYFFLHSDPPQIYCSLRDRYAQSVKAPYVNFTDTALVFYGSSTNRTLLTAHVPARSPFQYMSLENSGHVIIHDWVNQTWRPTGDLFSVVNCSIPNECGKYGVHSNNGQCTCPGADTGTTSYFKPINASQPNQGCSPVMALHCGSIQDQQLLNLTEVAYFSYFDVETAAFNQTDEQSCVQACSSNCSCEAALFMYYQNVTDGYCFLPSQLLSLQKNNSTESGYHSNAHIKVQIASESFAPNPSPNTGMMTEPVKKSSNVGVVLGSILGALSFLLLVGVVTIVFVRRRRRNQDPGKAFRKEKSLEEQEEQFEEIPGMPTRFSYEQLATATDNFANKLGEGGFGSVYMGELGKDNVAVKLLSGINQGRKEFLAEVQTIGKTHHFNLVRLIGFCAESHRMLVYEYMPNGSLDKWIFNKDQHTTLNWQLRCKIIVDIAKGLSYLHEECPQRIAHLDIKPQNILLDDKFNAKVSDFGLAKLIERDQTHVMTMMRGTPGYLAPEWLTSFITEKVDVYSFGVMVLEIVCRRRNLDPSQPPERAHLVRLLQDKIKMDRLLDLVCDDEIVIAVDRDEAIQMIKLATWCLNHDPDRRPSMSTVVKVLEGVVNVETGVESNFIASIPAMQSHSYDNLFTSSSDYASSASPPPSASLLSGAR